MWHRYQTLCWEMAILPCPHLALNVLFVPFWRYVCNADDELSLLLLKKNRSQQVTEWPIHTLKTKIPKTRNKPAPWEKTWACCIQYGFKWRRSTHRSYSQVAVGRINVRHNIKWKAGVQNVFVTVSKNPFSLVGKQEKKYVKAATCRVF